MLGLTCVHGISAGGDAARAGYEDPVRAGVQVLGRHLFGADFTPDVQAVAWASAAQANAPPSLLDGLPFVGWFKDYLDDVITYLANPEPIRSRVRSELARCGGPGRVVLAHSLGTVILFDLVLEALDKDAPLPCSGLVTIGSPLGVELDLVLEDLGDKLPPEVLQAFTDRSERARWVQPPPAGWSWVNLVDPDDVVTTGIKLFNPPDLGDFAGYSRMGVEHRPDIQTGNLLSAHGGYWDSEVVHHECLELISGAV